MVIRMIKLKNNLYLDGGKDRKKTPKQEQKNPFGRYCTFGYFDAMDTDSEKIDMETDEGPYAWQLLSKSVVGDMDGSCSIRNFLCVTDKEEKDAEFWAEDEKNLWIPLLFASFIRLKRDSDEGEVRKEMDKLNGEAGKIAYFSYEHSELVVFFRTNRYSDGHDFCEELHDRFQILKMYTIFSVYEPNLDTYNIIEDTIANETVGCRFRAVVKDWKKVDDMRRKMAQSLGLGNMEKIKRYHMIGKTDVLLEADGVPLRKLMACYKTGELLTHSNDDYKAAFFNVETEILCYRGEGNGRRLD